MTYDIGDHPEIKWCERTGYPSWNQPEVYHCSRCDDEIDGEVYEDFGYEYLCESCLLNLHKKEF